MLSAWPAQADKAKLSYDQLLRQPCQHSQQLRCVAHGGMRALTVWSSGLV